jgi:hypothetical protein
MESLEDRWSKIFVLPKNSVIITSNACSLEPDEKWSLCYISAKPLQFTVALWPASATQSSGKTPLTADQTSNHEPLYYTAASCPVLHQTTQALTLSALSSMITEPATSQ